MFQSKIWTLTPKSKMCTINHKSLKCHNTVNQFNLAAIKVGVLKSVNIRH